MAARLLHRVQIAGTPADHDPQLHLPVGLRGAAARRPGCPPHLRQLRHPQDPAIKKWLLAHPRFHLHFASYRADLGVAGGGQRPAGAVGRIVEALSTVRRSIALVGKSFVTADPRAQLHKFAARTGVPLLSDWEGLGAIVGSERLAWATRRGISSVRVTRCANLVTGVAIATWSNPACASEASYITGAALPVDGGATGFTRPPA